MKTVKTLLKVIAGVFLLAVLVCGYYIIYLKFFKNKEVKYNSYYTGQLPVEPSFFAEDFKEIYQTTLDNYSLYQAKQLNMDSLYGVFSTRLQHEVTTKTHYGKFLQEYFAALNVGHASVYLNSYRANYSPAYIESRLFIDHAGEYIASHGFRDKDEIIAIGGVPVQKWIAQNKKYTPASTEATRTLMTGWKAFSSLTDTLVNYRLIRQGDTLSIDLPLKEGSFFPRQKKKLATAKVLQDSIGYIALLSMMDSVVDDFAEVYQQVKNLPYLIIDVRQNGGGNSGNGKRICEYLVRKSQPHCVAPDWIIEPQTDAYQGKVYLLTSNFTFSAAESFVLDMRESNNATLIGEPTAGDTGNNPRNFRTARGICFRLPTREPAVSPQGFPMEGVGIPPHYQVSQTVSDFLEGEDTALEFALKLIEQKK